MGPVPHIIRAFPDRSEQSMTRDETQQFFDRRVDAWRRHDLDGLMRAHAEDCVLESPLAGKVTGRRAIENIYRAFVTSFPDFTVENPQLFVDGDRAVQTVTFSGTNTGGFMGMAPTDKRFSFAAVLICMLRDGLIVHEKRIYDFTGFLLEIGALRARPI
jgi:steroid delta-isomerase-like uncharacterized protein